MDPLLTADGCLTTAGIRALQTAPAGEAPQELALHVSSCTRCQGRLLALEAGPRPKRQAREGNPLKRAALTIGVVLGVMLLALAALLYTRARLG